LKMKTSKHYRSPDYCISSHLIFDPTGSKKCSEISELSLYTKYNKEENKDIDNRADVKVLEMKDEPPSKPVVSDVMFCHCCQVKLSDRDEQVSHYKCDWHRYNLHRRMKNLPAILEEEFDYISGDISSISGSDSDDTDHEGSQDEASLKFNELDSVDDEQSTVYNHPKLYFRNKDGDLMSIYRCLIQQKKFPIEDHREIEKKIALLPEKSNWIILMVSSGHFAGAVFNGKDVLEHKTFHRYTIRAKRGTAQSSKDSQGNAPKSAGASLRRHHEAALIQEVQELLTSWSDHIKTCDLVFTRVPVANKIMLFGGKSPAFKKEDPRIRTIPLTTRRPTFNEIKRVHQTLASVENYGKDADLNDFITVMPEKVSKQKKNFGHPGCVNELTLDNQIPDGLYKDTLEMFNGSQVENLVGETGQLKKSESVSRKVKKNFKATIIDSETVCEVKEDDDMIQFRNNVYTACKCGDVSSLKNNILTSNKSGSEKNSTNQDFVVTKTVSVTNSLMESGHAEDTTAIPDLSTVTIKGCIDSDMKNGSSFDIDVAQFLNTSVTDGGTTFLHLASKEGHDEIITTLLECGADPALRDKSGKTPYSLGDTKVRNAFRRFMADFPEKYDYTKAQIPSPLTAEMESEKKLKAAEKRKAKKKAQNEKNKDKKAAEAQFQAEKREKERFLALSDREKRALAAEKRFLQQNANQGTMSPVLSRCWQCGTDITGKVPFEYADYKFCTTKCLREHRSKPL
ncbi:ankyrin repeat and zinc finger domain-containing protein 1, partial [Biomphalaria glabrata]